MGLGERGQGSSPEDFTESFSTAAEVFRQHGTRRAIDYRGSLADIGLAGVRYAGQQKVGPVTIGWDAVILGGAPAGDVPRSSGGKNLLNIPRGVTDPAPTNVFTTIESRRNRPGMTDGDNTIVPRVDVPISRIVRTRLTDRRPLVPRVFELGVAAQRPVGLNEDEIMGSHVYRSRSPELATPQAPPEVFVQGETQLLQDAVVFPTGIGLFNAVPRGVPDQGLGELVMRGVNSAVASVEYQDQAPVIQFLDGLDDELRALGPHTG